MVCLIKDVFAFLFIFLFLLNLDIVFYLLKIVRFIKIKRVIPSIEYIFTTFGTRSTLEGIKITLATYITNIKAKFSESQSRVHQNKFL